MSETPKGAAGLRRRSAILAARTQALARSRRPKPPPPTVSCLVCEVDGDLFALPATSVARVSPEGTTSAAPTRNAAISGVAVVAGAIHHVIDLRRLAKRAETDAEEGRGRGHFVQLRGAVAPTALRVDRAETVIDLVQLAPGEVSGLAPAHAGVSGFARALAADSFPGRVIALLDPYQLAAGPARTSEGD